MSLRAVTGGDALQLLEQPAFRADWQGLLDVCPSPTPAMDPKVLDAFRREAPPQIEWLIVEERDEEAELTGLLMLSRSRADAPWSSIFAGSGVPQGWLARPLLGGYFAERAVREVIRRLPGEELVFDPVVENAPTDWAASSRRLGRIARRAPRSAFVIDLEDVTSPAGAARAQLVSHVSRLKAPGRLTLIERLDRADLVRLSTWGERRRYLAGGAEEASRPEITSIILRAADTSDLPILSAGLSCDGHLVAGLVAFHARDRAWIQWFEADPEREAGAFGMHLWARLEPRLSDARYRFIEVTRGPAWLRRVADRRARWSVQVVPRLGRRLREDLRSWLHREEP